jgi:hypothetical protein
MLHVRNEQMQAFEQEALKRFEDGMVEHIKKNFPKPMELAGLQAVRETIRLGIDKSRAYSLETEHEMCLYIDLTIMLGAGFDTDPQLPWANITLNDEAVSSSVKRIEKLYDKVMDYLNCVVGRDNLFPVNALRRIRTYTIGQLEERFESDVVRGAAPLFREIWPAKWESIGSAGLGRLIGKAYESASKYEIESPSDVGIYASFMFLLGHCFDTDPMYPWASKILADDSVTTPKQKIHSLHAKAMALLNKALS